MARAAARFEEQLECRGLRPPRFGAVGAMNLPRGFWKAHSAAVLVLFHGAPFASSRGLV